MADETYYAWTRMPIERNEWGQVSKEIQPGDKVTQSMLKVEDAEWQELVDAGAIRTDEYPADDLTPPAQIPQEQPEPVASVKELRLGTSEPPQQSPPPQGKPTISEQLANK